MIVIDSGTKTLTKTHGSLYVSSEEWGQPPASHQVTEIVANRGTEEESQPGSIYVTTGPPHMAIDPGLEAEFAAWDIASDEALLNFEAGLD